MIHARPNELIALRKEQMQWVSTMSLLSTTATWRIWVSETMKMASKLQQ
jgi:hypothetical protein